MTKQEINNFYKATDHIDMIERQVLLIQIQKGFYLSVSDFSNAFEELYGDDFNGTDKEDYLSAHLKEYYQ